MTPVEKAKELYSKFEGAIFGLNRLLQSLNKGD